LLPCLLLPLSLLRKAAHVNKHDRAVATVVACGSSSPYHHSAMDLPGNGVYLWLFFSTLDKPRGKPTTVGDARVCAGCAVWLPRGMAPVRLLAARTRCAAPRFVVPFPLGAAGPGQATGRLAGVRATTAPDGRFLPTLLQWPQIEQAVTGVPRLQRAGHLNAAYALDARGRGRVAHKTAARSFPRDTLYRAYSGAMVADVRHGWHKRTTPPHGTVRHGRCIVLPRLRYARQLKLDVR